MMARFAVFLALSLSCSTLTCLSADDMPVPVPVPADPDLPQPFDPAAFLPMLRSSPFNRVVDYTDTLQLTGVAWVDGKPMATFQDRQTKRQIVVSDQANAQGWKLSEVNLSEDLRDYEIKLQVGDEQFAFRYNEAQITPVAKAGTASRGVQASNAPRITSTDSRGSAPSRSTSAYLSSADQEYYRHGMSKEARDKFRESMREHQDKMDKMTDAQRSAYSQKIFNKIKAQESGVAKPTSKKAARR